MKKKILSIALTAALMLSSAGQAVYASDEYETGTAIVSYTSAKTKKIPDSAYDDSEYFIAAFDKDENVKIFTYEEFIDEVYPVIMYNGFSSKDYYKKYYSSDMSYKKYKEELMNELDLSPEKIAEFDKYKTVYAVMCSDYRSGEKKSGKNAKKAAFEYVRKRINSGNFPEISKLIKNGSGILIVVSCNEEDGFINVSAEYSAYSDSGRIFIENDYITADGKKAFTVGNTPVSADTKSIFISAYSYSYAGVPDGVSAEDYETVILDHKSAGYDRNGGAASVDIKQLAENCPKLQKLCVSSNIVLKNISYLSKFKNLKELSIDVSGCKNIAFLKNVKTQRLILSGLECSPAPLSEIKAKEISITLDAPTKYMKEIYKLKNVTALTVGRYGGTEKLDLSGIENMTGLKKLDISVGSGYALDAAPLARLKNLESLDITAYKVTDLDKISELKKLKRLMLHSMNGEDLSFLSKMTGLEELWLYYVNNSFCKALPSLTNVKELVIVDITGAIDYSQIYKMKNIRTLHFMDGNVSVKGISSLKKLENLSLMLCDYGDLSELKKCGSLKTLMIYNCTTPYFNAENIRGMKSLEALSLSCAEIDNYKALEALKGLKSMKLYFCNLTSDELKEIKYYLPECDIELDDESHVSAEGYKPVKSSDNSGKKNSSSDDELTVMQTWNIDGVNVRYAKVNDKDSYYTGVYIIKNTGKKKIENIIEHLSKKNMFNGYTRITAEYPPKNGEEYTNAIEVIPIKNGKPDYASSELYLPVLYSGDYDDADFRQLDAGDEMEIWLIRES